MSTNTSFAANGLGTNSGSLFNGTMVVGGGCIIINNVAMNGAPQGSQIPNLAWIQVVSNPPGGIYAYQIQVNGACPEGSYDLKLVFTDQTGDTYTLRIYSDSTSLHTVDYNSSEPTIAGVTWDA